MTAFPLALPSPGLLSLLSFITSGLLGREHSTISFLFAVPEIIFAFAKCSSTIAVILICKYLAKDVAFLRPLNFVHVQLLTNCRAGLGSDAQADVGVAYVHDAPSHNVPTIPFLN